MLIFKKLEKFSNKKNVNKNKKISKHKIKQINLKTQR